MNIAAPAIDIRNLVKRYPVRHSLRDRMLGRVANGFVSALADINFSVAQGEVLGLLGPNGAGKTTLINILSTLLTPSSGSVSVGGFDLSTHAAEARRQVGLVTSNERSFYWRLSGRENLRFFAALYQVPEQLAEQRINEFLHGLDLERFADHRFDTYSTGVRQRFAFARAMLHKPSILFMDEPTKGLDPNASAALLHLIEERILKTWRPTIIITSHNLTEIEMLCDRVAIVNQGRLLRIGTIETLVRSMAGLETYLIRLSRADARLTTALRTLLGEQLVTARVDDPAVLELRFSAHSRLSDALRIVLEHDNGIERVEPIEVSLVDVFRETLRQGTVA